MIWFINHIVITTSSEYTVTICTDYSTHVLVLIQVCKCMMTFVAFAFFVVICVYNLVFSKK